MIHVIGWAEIPVADYKRAKAFYEALMDGELQEMDAGEGRKSAVFPMEMNEENVGVSILEMDGFVPNENGVLIYLNAGDDIDGMLERVTAAGGEVVIPRSKMGDNAGGGYYATFKDTEGNTLALHAEA